MVWKIVEVRSTERKKALTIMHRCQRVTDCALQLRVMQVYSVNHPREEHNTRAKRARNKMACPLIMSCNINTFTLVSNAW